MSWIQEVRPEDAKGLLKRVYDEAVKRAGRIWNIVRVMSLNPETGQRSFALYAAIMKGPSPLTKYQRELLAVVVSAEVDCFY